MCDYPKALESKIDKISRNIDAVYATAIKKHELNQITIIRDCVGATLAITLTQRLVIKGIPIPRKLILVFPVMDATISNPQIKKQLKNQ